MILHCQESGQSVHRWRWGCQACAPAALYSQRNIFLVLIFVIGWFIPRSIVRLKRLDKLKIFIDFIGTLALLWRFPKNATLNKKNEILCSASTLVHRSYWEVYKADTSPLGLVLHPVLSSPFPFVLQRIKQPAIVVIWPWSEITVFTRDGSDFKDSMKE